MPDTSFPLRVVVVEPLAAIGTALLRDLDRLHVVTETASVITHVAKASAVLHTAPPHVVFISLDMPNDGVFTLLKPYPLEGRPFLAILLTTPEFDKYLPPKLLTDIGCAGYLVKGKFGDAELLLVMEKVRHQLQTMLAEGHKTELLHEATRLSDAPLAPKPFAPKPFAPKPPVSKSLVSKPLHSLHTQTATNGTPQHSPQEISSQETSFIAEVKQNGTMIQQEILWEQVVYMKSDKNYLDVWYFPETAPASGTDAVSAPIQHALVRRDKVNIPETFVKPHRSFWVNGNYIIDVRPNAIRVATGKWLDVSRANQQRLMEVLEWHSEPLVVANELIRRLKANIAKREEEENRNKSIDGVGRRRKPQRKRLSLA